MNFRTSVSITAVMLLGFACDKLPSPQEFRPYEAIDIMPDADGRLSEKENEAGLKGRWYSYAGLKSVIHPVPLERFALEDRKICTNGTAAAIENNEYALYFGAGIGFHVCLSDDNDNPPEFPYSLSECPFAKSSILPRPETKIAGISFKLETEGDDHPVIRVIFREWQQEENPYVAITAPGTHQAFVKDAKIEYEAKCQNEPNFSAVSHPAEIISILFQVEPSGTITRPFAFCISELKLLVTPEMETDTSLYEDTNPNSLDAGEACSPANYLDAGLDWVAVADGNDTAAFEMLKTEVTAAQFKKCQDAKCCMNTAKQFAQCDNEKESKTGDWEICSLNNMQGEPRPQEPANCVNWYQARAFCHWAGGRLPLKEEWEKAAAGGDSGKDYPWGTEEPTCALTVMDDVQTQCAYEGSTLVKPRDICTCEDNARAVGDKTGLCDMAGNVWEWLEDWHPPSAGIPKETFRMLKGGSYFSKPEALSIETTGMEHPTFPRDRGKIGFRCIK